MRRAVGVVAAVAVLLLGACIGDGEPRTGAGGAARVWTSSGVVPFTGVVNVDGVAVLYTRHEAVGGQELRVTALDPATGKELWHDAASPAEVARGIAMSVADVGGHVAYYRPAGAGTELVAVLVLADPRTGKAVAVSEPRHFASAIEGCVGDPARACATAWNDASQKWEAYRFGAAGSRLVPDAVVPSGARPLAAGGLIDLGSRAPERLARIGPRGVMWSRPLADYFGPGGTTDAGWTFDLYEAVDVYVGSVGDRTWLANTSELARSRTAGISAADGRLLWSDSGTDVACLGSLVVTAPSAPGRPDAGAEPLPLRCRYTGIVRRDATGNRSATGLTVTLERFDVRTGRASWRTPLGRAPALAGVVDDASALADDTHLVVDTGADHLLVDLTTGATAPTTPATRVWCRPRSKLKYPVPVYYDDKPTYDIYGQGLAFPCTLDGKPAESPVTAVPGNVAAVFAGGLAVYASPGAVIAYRRP